MSLSSRAFHHSQVMFTKAALPHNLISVQHWCTIVIIPRSSMYMYFRADGNP